EAQDYLKELGVKEPGLAALIHSTYHLLGLRTFFTFNEKEVRAWTIRAGDTAVKAAGNPYRFRARVHQGGDGELGGTGETRLGGARPGNGPLPNRGPRLCGAGRRRAAFQVQCVKRVE